MMWTEIKGWLAPPIFEDQEQSRTAALLNVISLVFMGLMVALLINNALSNPGGTIQRTVIAVFFSVAAITYVLMRLRFLQIASLCLLLGLWAALAFYMARFGGIRLPAFGGYLLVTVMAGLLLGKRGIIIFTILGIAGGASALFAELNGLLVIGFDEFRPMAVNAFVTQVVILILAAVLFYLSIAGLAQALQRARQNERELSKSNQELQAIQATLEERIMARTQRLETVAALSGQLVSILNIEQLLSEMVNQIKSQFGYYHAQIYLFNKDDNNLVLAGATGQAGQIMLAQSHTIPLGRGLVGRAAQQRKVVLAPNLARIIAPEVVTAKNIEAVYQREADPTFRSQWYRHYITHVFGSLDELAAGSEAAAGRLKLGYVMYDFGEFSIPIRQGALDAARDLGVEIELAVPPHSNQPDQLIEAFDRLIAAGKDGLAIIPQFQSVWPSYFNKANKANIPVVTVNLTGPDVANWVWFGQDSYQGGFALAIEFKQHLQAAGYHAGQIVVGISGTREPGHVARYEGFKAGLVGAAFTCSELFHSDTIDPKMALRRWSEFIEAHPKLIAVVGLTAQAIPTLSEIKTKTNASWLIAGFDLEPVTMEALKAGLAQVTIAQHPYLQGYLPVLALVQHLRQGKPLSDWVIEGWLPNPLLPDTKAEISAPIVLEGQVEGVLDVQVDKVGGLDESDAALLQSLANQVAAAIRNARLFTEVETALADIRAAQERYITQSWQQFRPAQPSAERLYVQPGKPELAEDILNQTRNKALVQQHPAIVSLDGESNAKPLVAPISLGGKTIGALQLHKIDAEDNSRLWSEQDLDFVETILDQVAQTAENLRLFGETQERASREQTIRMITDKLRASPNLGALLETAARELGQRLGVRHTVLELGVEPELEQDNGHNSN
jgi:ABC-type sugar transport system substrate-binding protein